MSSASNQLEKNANLEEGHSRDNENLKPSDDATHEDCLDDLILMLDDDRSVSSRETRKTSCSTFQKESDIANSAEEWKVKKARRLFLSVMLIAAIVLGGVVYWITREEETEDFHSQFNNYGHEVIEASNANVLKAFHSLETLSVAVTGFVKEQSDNGYPAGWVKIPDTEFHLTKAQQNAGAFVVGYMPHVDKQDYDLWNQFSVENQDWIAEANLAHGRDDDRFHSGVSLFHPFLHEYQFYNEANERVELPFEVGTCSDRASERLIKEIKPTIVETRAVAEPPSTYAYDYYVPVWQLTPPPHPDHGMGLGNYNLVNDAIFKQTFEIIQETRATTFFDICEGSEWFNPAAFPEDGIYSLILSPVFEDFSPNARIVGTLSAVVTWSVFFQDILVTGSEPVHAVMKNKCGDKSFTYLVDGEEARFLGHDYDAHDSAYDGLVLRAPFAEFAYSDDYLALGNNSCTYTMSVYPTTKFEDSFSSNEPVIFGSVVLAVFLITALAFFAFDWIVRKRQNVLVLTAQRQNALVSSLFPKKIQKKLLADIEEAEHQRRSNMGKAGLRKYLSDNNNDPPKTATEPTGTKPIADLFPDTTIMFADIAGFTAWSSTREPSQVFVLLETMYTAFDGIAARRDVFKVETIGDCYVAVAGLPDPRPDHAQVMCRFANDCLNKMRTTVENLERELGPDTAELSLRLGLHSGACVAGVLRGQKARFQLFGDTMNTASRMESTSLPNRIQISQETADHLTNAGKEHWFFKREGKVVVKGKGELQTYWLASGHGDVGHPGSTAERKQRNKFILEQKVKTEQRLCRWTSELLSHLLRDIIAHRNNFGIKSDPILAIAALERSTRDKPLDEVEEIIELPEYVRTKRVSKQTKDDVELDALVVDELNAYVRVIASLYRENSFHNFQHASHVTMSVSKLLSRIVAPDVDEYIGKSLHDHTYGITGDPLTSFSVVLSALIHDVDHTGAPNTQMVKEDSPVVSLYGVRSVAEQNSVDLAWNLLMSPEFANLRRQIYVTKTEYKRFRQLVVNTVLATDIMDKQLKELRNNRWDKAFHKDGSASQRFDHGSFADDDRNRKATIVIEHLIQASDVAHTMQHWHVYRKWNEKFFRECYKAYVEGRSETDPSVNWYEGEKGFFDFYIIPLAKKLKDCGVFGVASEEYLQYAQQNRKEWEVRGREVVAEMTALARREIVRKDGLSTSSQHSVAQLGDTVV